MNNPNLKKTEANGWYVGNLPVGCQLCVKGMKLVYFMGGDCPHPSHCNWYCPISSERKKPNAHFADEIPIENPDSIPEILEQLKSEAKLIGALGMSFTGGDPLNTSIKIDKVCDIIQAMKIEFGDDFHIHLYTSGKTFDAFAAEKLEFAGLDELRFHPAEEDFYKIEFAANRVYKFGAEVPVIPSEENHEYLLKLADYLDMIGADFLNLNEFEICAPNHQILLEKGYRLEPNTIATVAGSREYAEKFINSFEPRGGLSVHFCPAALKDGIQIKNRYIRRASNIQRDFEIISDDGCLIFLRIEGSYNELKKIYTELSEDAGIPSHMIDYDVQHGFIDLPSILSEEDNFLDFLSDYKVKAGIMEIYPFREPKLATICEYTPIMDKKIRKKS